jgi:hypothetical protein
MMKKLLTLAAVFSLLILSCTKKTTTNNNYYSTSGEGGAIVGIVSPSESNAKVSAHMGIEIASTRIDERGYYKLTGLPAGTYSLLVQAEGYDDYEQSPYIKVTEGETVLMDTVFLTSIHDLIISVAPSDGAEQVDVDERIRIRFRREMNRETVQAAFHVEPTVEGEFSWQDYRPYGSVDLLFAPVGQFATSTLYKVTVDATASDSAGITLSEPCQFSFTTQAVRIEYTNPKDNDTGVPLVIYVRIYFNTDMDAKSVNSAFKMVDSELRDVMGDFVWNSARQMRFYPNSALAPKEEYTVTIDATASDALGARLPEPYQLSFTTEALEVDYTSPSHNQTWVPPTTYIRIAFNTDMDVESVNSAFKMVDSELWEVTGTFAWSDRQRVIFFPNSALAVDEEYTVTIDTTASDARGTRLSEPYQFSFITQPLMITSVKPTHKSTWIPVTTNVLIAFNTDMDMESVNSAFRMVDSEQKEVAGEFVWQSLSRLEFDPDSDLAYGEKYTVTIDTNAKDTYGATLSQAYTFWFKTRTQ